MLKKLRIKGFKSLRDVEINLAPLTVLFGPNAVGKSNLIDALQVLSRLCTLRKDSDPLLHPIRGHPIECFSFPEGGIEALLKQDKAHFSFETDIASDSDNSGQSFHYDVEVEIRPRTGATGISRAQLTRIDERGNHISGVDLPPSTYEFLLKQLSEIRSYYLDPRVAILVVAVAGPRPQARPD